MIQFFTDKINYKYPYGFKKKCIKWLHLIALNESKTILSLNVILTSDEELFTINKQFLNHHDLTDIITFDYSEQNHISGELYISLDRVTENATQYKQYKLTEVQRIIVHGFLHLCGYADKTHSEKILMTQKEDYYLALI